MPLVTLEGVMVGSAEMVMYVQTLLTFIFISQQHLEQCCIRAVIQFVPKEKVIFASSVCFKFKSCRG